MNKNIPFEKIANIKNLTTGETWKHESVEKMLTLLKEIQFVLYISKQELSTAEKWELLKLEQEIKDLMK